MFIKDLDDSNCAANAEVSHEQVLVTSSTKELDEIDELGLEVEILLLVVDSTVIDDVVGGGVDNGRKDDDDEVTGTEEVLGDGKDFISEVTKYSIYEQKSAF